MPSSGSRLADSRRRKRDLDAIQYNTGLLEHLRKDPSFIGRFHTASSKFLNSGKVEEGRALAKAALHLAVVLEQPRAQSHYQLARAYAVLVSNRFWIHRPDGRGQLVWAFEAHQDYRRYYAQDSMFDAIRRQIDAEVQSQILLYRRRLGRPLAEAD